MLERLTDLREVLGTPQHPRAWHARLRDRFIAWEEQNAVVRGIQIYASALTEAQILALEGLETDAEVLTAVGELGVTSLWYLNMNPRPSDVTDKSGSGHDPVWDGVAAMEWRAP